MSFKLMVRTVFESDKMNGYSLSVFDVIPGLPRNPGGLRTNSWMPDQVRHDTASEFECIFLT